jgi:hypothetical protein
MLGESHCCDILLGKKAQKLLALKKKFINRVNKKENLEYF